MDLTLDELKEINKTEWKNSLYKYSKYGLGYKDMVPHVHGPICRALQENTTRKLITVPRGTFKSSLATVSFPMWKLDHHDANMRIMIDSEKFTNSKNFLREIKGHYETNHVYIDHYGDRRGPVWNESEIILNTRTRMRKEPSIVCSGVGAHKTSQHYDMIIADDLSSYENVNNPEVAKKVLNHYRGYTSLLEPKSGILVVIGTRYSELDIIGYIIEQELGIKHQDVKTLREMYRESDQS